jgi:hypothetical protein
MSVAPVQNTAAAAAAAAVVHLLQVLPQLSLLMDLILRRQQ